MLRISENVVLLNYLIGKDGIVRDSNDYYAVPTFRKSREKYKYLKVKLKEQGQTYIRSIGTLMKFNFFSEEDWNKEVHHINQDPSDNRLENLQLLTALEHQNIHKTLPNVEHGLGKESNRYIPDTRIPLVVESPNGGVIELESARETAEYLNLKSFSPPSKGKYKISKGFRIWRKSELSKPTALETSAKKPQIELKIGGEWRRFETKAQAARDLGLKPSTLNMRIRAGKVEFREVV